MNKSPQPWILRVTTTEQTFLLHVLSPPVHKQELPHHTQPSSTIGRLDLNSKEGRRETDSAMK